nr:nucleotide disphospho-sugar-binding domain-containing protein [Pseudenhygromyxa sp. WMMC2535]
MLDALPEGIACPEDLEDLPRARGPGVVHLGPCLCPRRGRGQVEGGRARPRVLAALGSQARMFPERAREVLAAVFSAAALAAAEGLDWEFVVATAKLVEAPAQADNLKVLEWLPQAELLPGAAAMITHGGLGTVKECVLAEVPMVVAPLGRDQPANARRVVHHGLGRAFVGCRSRSPRC